MLCLISDVALASQSHPERRTAASSLFHGHDTSVGFGQRLDDAEPQPQTALGSAVIAAVKPSPDFPALCFRHSRTVVRYRENHAAPGIRCGLQPDLAALRGVLQGVVRQVREDLPQPRRVGPDLDAGLGLPLEPRALLFGHDRKQIDHAVQELGHIN